MNASDAIQDFWTFVSTVRTIWKWVFQAAAASSLICLISDLGPPWPTSAQIAILSVLAELIVYLVSYQLVRPKTVKVLGQLLMSSVCCSIAMLLLYMFLTSTFVMHLTGGTEAKGFHYSERGMEDRELYKTERGRYPTDTELVEREGDDVIAVYVPWTVSCIRIALLALWLGLYAVISATFSIFVARCMKSHVSRRRPG